MSSLDYSLNEFRELLHRSSDLIIDRFEGLEEAKAFSGLEPEEVRSWFDEPIPEDGMRPNEVLNIVKEKIVDTATLNMGPNMYAYVMAGGTQISIIAEMLATTINQNVGKWHLAPAVSELEKRVVSWGAEFIGYDKNAGGVLVSGGSAANLTGLTVARNVYFEKENIKQKGLFGFAPFVVYASEEVHNCVDKSVETLGIGTDNYRKIPTREDFTIDINVLRAQIEQDLKDGLKPFCLIGNAGTVNTGAIDPLDELALIASQYNMWYHVDGAYGALAAGTKVKNLFNGMEKADSIAIDFHKWLYQPFEAGCTLVKDWSMLNKTYYKKASYLFRDGTDDGRFDFNDHHFQLSRNAKALKIWMSFKAYGRKRLVQMIEKDIQLTKYLGTFVDQSKDFDLCNSPDLGIVCFRYLGTDGIETDPNTLDHLNRKIITALEKDGRVFITGTILNNRPVIRACLINHRLEHQNVDFLIKVIREVGQSMDPL